MSFKENFEKGGQKDDLGYDDSAFYYFILALLLIVLIPATYKMILEPMIYGDFNFNSSLKNPECDLFKERMKKRAQAYSGSWFNAWFVLKVLILAVLWFTAWNCYEMVKDLEPLKQFIPHELLGIEADATSAQAKKAYRKLSREKHPDKNPDNPEAVAEFIQITKAYTIMTDDKARDNFIKYGNPDGQGSFAVGIALPNFLNKQEFQLQVLLAFFIIVIIVIPYWFWIKIDESQKDLGGIELETRQVITELIDEHIDLKRIPGMLQFSSEFQAMRVRTKEELAVCKRLRENEKIKQYIPKINNPRFPEVQVKPIVLLAGFLHGVLDEQKDLSVGDLREDLEKILKDIPTLMEIILEQTLMLNTLFRAGRSPRRILAKNVLTVIQFQQNLMAGAAINKDPYSQLPGFDVDECKRAAIAVKGSNLDSYCKKTRAEREALAVEIFGDKKGSKELAYKIDQQEKCIDALPIVKLTMTAEVEGEDEIVVGDILTCKLTVNFLNLEEGQRSGYVFSKQYPFLRRDCWYLVVTDESLMGLAACEKINTVDNVFTKEFKERVQRPGPIKFTAILTNDSYRGLDQVQKIEVNVKAASQSRVIPEYYKQDIKELKANNVALQIAGLTINDVDTETDSEEDINEEAELERKLKEQGLMKSKSAKKDD